MIDSFEVQNQSLIRTEFWSLKCAPVPARAEKRVIADSAGGRFGRKRNNNMCVPVHFAGVCPSCVSIDREFPGAVQIDPLRPCELWTGIGRLARQIDSPYWLQWLKD